MPTNDNIPSLGDDLHSALDTPFLSWISQHEGLIKLTILNRSPAITISAPIDSGKTLPNPNSDKIPETAEETKLIDDLFNEFGGTILRESTTERIYTHDDSGTDGT